MTTITPSSLNLEITPPKEKRRKQYDLDALIAEAENLPKAITPEMQRIADLYKEKLAMANNIEYQLQSYLLQNNHNLVEKITKENAMNVSG